jgi:DNA-binding response OmpR family regulator
MPKKILLADDSVTIQKVVSITLAHEDFDLTIVDNGSKAVSKAKEIKPDVILLDVVMPDKDGYQVCQEIKGNADLKDTPVILLTGTFEPFDADRAAEVGADDFIKKPFESHTLINKVKEMASRSGVSRGKPVDISGVDIDFETPIEAEYETTPTTRETPRDEAVATDDLETPWETETDMKTTDRSVTQQESEDIWSVEEFEDIGGTGAETKPRERAARPPIAAETEGPPPRPSGQEPIKEEPSREAAVTDEFFVREGKPRDVDVEDFELGEEISEDDLEKFLEEETTDVEIGVEEEPETGRPNVSRGDDEIFLSEESDPSARPGGKTSRPVDEDLFVEEFEGSPQGREGRKQTGDFLAEGSDEEEPIELEWEDEPPPKAQKAPDRETATDEFETLIRRTAEEELADFSQEQGTTPGAGRGPATREFDVDLSSFDEQPRRGETQKGRPDLGTFDFEELSKETPLDGGGLGEEPAAGGFGEPADKKDMSKAVDKIAREVIEKVVWEVVPELAEELIKQEIKRLKGEKS